MMNSLTIRSVAARAVLAPLPRPVRTAVGDGVRLMVDVNQRLDVLGRYLRHQVAPFIACPISDKCGNQGRDDEADHEGSNRRHLPAA